MVAKNEPARGKHIQKIEMVQTQLLNAFWLEAEIGGPRWSKGFFAQHIMIYELRAQICYMAKGVP